jgi:hypothetical protein
MATMKAFVLPEDWLKPAWLTLKQNGLWKGLSLISERFRILEKIMSEA